MNKTSIITTALSVLSCVGLQAQAGEAPAIASSAPVPAAESSAWMEKESLFLDELNEKLFGESGFSLAASWTGEVIGNVSGGAGTGTVWNSLFTIEGEQDMGKAGSIGFSSFIYNSTDHAFGDYLGTGSGPSSIMAAANVARFFEVYYTNTFETESGDFTIRLGQLASDETFMGLDFTDVFMNTSWGAIPTMAGNGLANGDTAYAQYAVATVGGVLTYEYKNITMNFGLYNGNAGIDQPSNTGFDYKMQDLLFWYQVDIGYTLGGQDGFFRFGFNHHTGEFENYTTGGTTDGLTSYQIALSQNLSSNEEGDPTVGVFSRFAWAPDQEVADYTVYYDFGLNWFGPFAGREDDVAAIGLAVMKLGNGMKRAADVEGTSFDTFLEMTYKYQVTNFMSIQPNAQIFFDALDENGERSSALVIGARMELVF